MTPAPAHTPRTHQQRLSTLRGKLLELAPELPFPLCVFWFFTFHALKMFWFIGGKYYPNQKSLHFSRPGVVSQTWVCLQAVPLGRGPRTSPLTPLGFALSCKLVAKVPTSSMCIVGTSVSHFFVSPDYMA